MRAPIIWDFDNISSIVAHPMDPDTITITGGHFTTMADQGADTTGVYYNRGIRVQRSNVVIDGLHHIVTGETPGLGAAYNGFINIANCANITVQNTVLTGRRFNTIIGSAGSPVPLGTYDIVANRSINVTLYNVTQTNDIHDRELWGIFASNHSKNIVFDKVVFSRFDAHMGVTNATIRNSSLGHQGINLIGHGTFLLENSRVYSGRLIGLRNDYGSTFDGDIIIRNSEFIPNNGRQSDAVLIGGSNHGRHDFGYVCHMPRRIVIDGLIVHDINPPGGYRGPRFFNDFNSANRNEAWNAPFPQVITEEVEIISMEIMSGRRMFVSDNVFMFRNTNIIDHADVMR
jgi:hypothetical protein